MRTLRFGKRDQPIHDWCNYVAVDGDGGRFEYENEPRESEMCFQDEWIPPSGKFDLLFNGKPPKDWTQELWKVT